jgi:glycosyltransferase involved in cell wall biosynthesis
MPRNAVIHVADFGAPYGSSFISSLQALEPCLQQAGLRQVLVLPARARQRNWAAQWQAENDTPLFFLSEGTVWSRAGQVASIARQQGGMLLHSHFSPADWISWFARLRLQAASLSVRPPCPLVWHYQSPPVSAGFGRQLLGPLKYRLLSRSVHHVAVSEGTLQLMLARGIPKHLCRVVCNSINLERATSATSPRAQVRSELGIAAEQKCFLLFGHDPERKGVDLALKAAAKLAAEKCDFKLVIVGQDKMRRYVEACLGGPAPAWLRLVEARETVADYYQAFDFFLSPSRAEGLPFAVLEALANQLPVISSDIPGLEWARGLDAVRLCPPGEAGSVAAQMKRLLVENSEDRTAAALRARNYVRERHSSQNWAREMLGVYLSVMDH